MSSGGTGGLPPFRSGGTGHLRGVPAQKPPKSGGPRVQDPALASLTSDVSKAIGEWYADPGDHKRPPEWLVERIAGRLIDHAKTKGEDLPSDQVTAQIRKRLEKFAHAGQGSGPSPDEIRRFAEAQVDEFARALQGTAKDGRMMPVV